MKMLNSAIKINKFELMFWIIIIIDNSKRRLEISNEYNFPFNNLKINC